MKAKHLQAKRKHTPKSTAKEMEARIDYVARLLTEQPNLSRYALHHLLCKKWSVDWHTIDRYVSRAREEILARLGRTQEEIRSNAVAFYERIISDKKMASNIRLKAQENLCELLGVKAPTKLEVTGADGQPLVAAQAGVQVLLNTLSVDDLKRIIDKMEIPVGDESTNNEKGQP